MRPLGPLRGAIQDAGLSLGRVAHEVKLPWELSGMDLVFWMQ